MKVRIIKDHNYVSSHFVQIKPKWLPFWWTAYTGTVLECKDVFNNYMKTKEPHTIVLEGETK